MRARTDPISAHTSLIHGKFSKDLSAAASHRERRLLQPCTEVCRPTHLQRLVVSPGLLQLHTEAAGCSSNNMTALAVANKWERQWGLQDLAAVVEQEPRPDQSIAEGWQPAVFAMLQDKQLHKAT